MMISLTQYSHKLTLVAMILLTTVGYSQHEIKESFKTSSETVVKLNSSYTQISFESWDKNRVEVEAYIDGNELTESEKTTMMDAWDFSIKNENNVITVRSLAKGSRGVSGGTMLEFFNDMTIVDPFASEMLNTGNMIAESSNAVNGEDASLGDMKFDYEAYQKDPKKYMEEFEAQTKSKMATNEESSQKLMEEKMSRMVEQFKLKGMNYSQEVITDANGNKTYILQGTSTGIPSPMKQGKKSLIIRMPKNTKTELDIRHGEVKMVHASNVKATLNYAPFTANSIDGGDTYITAAYAPVVINNWGNGTLYVKFVDTCDLKDVKEINLTANSSGIFIGTLRSRAKISASFGALRIDAIDKDFKKLNLVLDNMNTGINIPESSFAISFNGKRSTMQYNRNIELSSKKQYDRVLVDGYYKSRDTERELLISAAYSNLILR